MLLLSTDQCQCLLLLRCLDSVVCTVRHLRAFPFGWTRPGPTREQISDPLIRYLLQLDGSTYPRTTPLKTHSSLGLPSGPGLRMGRMLQCDHRHHQERNGQNGEPAKGREAAEGRPLRLRRPFLANKACHCHSESRADQRRSEPHCSSPF